MSTQITLDYHEKLLYGDEHGLYIIYYICASTMPIFINITIINVIYGEYTMGKRSDFDRIEKDYYRTFDPKAGNALRSHLPTSYTYAEPFCGRGDLINQLDGKCVLASDIEPDYDFNLTDINFVEKDYRDIVADDVRLADYIITNPPWSRPILHHSITHFVELKPTWFLFDAGWAFTKQASPFVDKYCEKIVTIGRMNWIEGTSVSGKDDCAWYLFNKSKQGDTKFYGRNY